MNLILADTSVWADHLRYGDDLLRQLLIDRRIRMHPYVIGELAMGNLPHRARTLTELNAIHLVPLAADQEVMQLIEHGPHFGSGLSWVDAHLLTSVVLVPGVNLWTRDRRLNAAAERHGRSAALHH